MLETTESTLFLDKTPAYALITDFVSKLYPSSKYITLTRHPLAILSSYANSFFEGDYKRAYAFNPILDRYVPAIARFIRQTEVPQLHVRYEDVVADPEKHLKQIFTFMGLEDEPEAVNYGQHKHIKKSYGDPKVDDNQRPVTASVAKWARELANNGEKLSMARGIISGLDPRDLEAWGYPIETLFDAVDEAREGGKEIPKEPINAYRIQRKILLRLRDNIHENTFGKAVKAVRYYCDVLLRD
jgi:hypothetical protein